MRPPKISALQIEERERRMYDSTHSPCDLPSGHFGRAGAMLSPREMESLQLMARGFSCAEIARLQLISVHTTRTHLKSIYSKLDVHSRTEAVYEATVLGLLEPAGRTTPDRQGPKLFSADSNGPFEQGASRDHFLDRV